MRNAILVVFAAVFALASREAFGQALTVQQPQFDFFGVGTSVSVPDRGRMFLGGIDQSAHGRTSFGPLRSAYGIGSEVSAARSDVSVWILDQQEMDRAVLGAAGPGATRFSPAPGDRAGRAMRHLALRQSEAASAMPQVRNPSTPVGAPTHSGEIDADTLLARGRQHEAEGRIELALAYYRSARRLGCTEAAARLRELGRQ